MALCPFAVQRLIPPGVNDPPIVPRVAILHVDGGGALSLFKFFRDRSGGIESHFHVTWNGKIEQYRDTDWEADANHLANPFAISIETQGFATGRWTAKQSAAIKELLLWLNKEHGIPLVKCPAWDGAGVGYHIQFGTPGKWTPSKKSCPGPLRIEQFEEELVPWMASLTPSPVPPSTRVAQFRQVLEEALTTVGDVPPTRVAAWRMFDAVREALAKGPVR